MTLPARKEGIIPGAANLRFPRFVGPRIARQAIMMGKRLDCDSAEGRMVCDLVVPPAEVGEATMKVCDDFTSSGVVSAASNRRAFRVGEEPLDTFRRYMAVYAREQAYCHFSPALIANLEKHWNAANEKSETPCRASIAQRRGPDAAPRNLRADRDCLARRDLGAAAQASEMDARPRL